MVPDFLSNSNTHYLKLLRLDPKRYCRLLESHFLTYHCINSQLFNKKIDKMRRNNVKESIEAEIKFYEIIQRSCLHILFYTKIYLYIDVLWPVSVLPWTPNDVLAASILPERVVCKPIYIEALGIFRFLCSWLHPCYFSISYETYSKQALRYYLSSSYSDHP